MTGVPLYLIGSTRLKACNLILHNLPRSWAGPRDPSGRCMGYGSPKRPMTHAGSPWTWGLAARIEGIVKAAWPFLLCGPTLISLDNRASVSHLRFSCGRLVRPRPPWSQSGRMESMNVGPMPLLIMTWHWLPLCSKGIHVPAIGFRSLKLSSFLLVLFLIGVGSIQSLSTPIKCI